MEIGKVIKENRIARNMTQEDLAKEFFVSRPLISKWENGKSYPDLEQLLKLSDFFDLTLDELLRGDKKMTKKLSFNLKKKNIMIGVIISLFIVVVSLLYFDWSKQIVQLTPNDIEILSIESTKVSEKRVFNNQTNKEEILPENVSYKINFKSKKKFVRINSVHVFESWDDEDSIIYVDIQTFNSLFKIHDTDILDIPAKSASLYNDQRIDDLSKYNLINKDKSIYLLNIDRLQKDASWKLIDKSELN